MHIVIRFSPRLGVISSLLKELQFAIHGAHAAKAGLRQLLQTHKLVVFERHVHKGYTHSWSKLLLQAMRRRHQCGPGAQHSVIRSLCCLVTLAEQWTHDSPHWN